MRWPGWRGGFTGDSAQVGSPLQPRRAREGLSRLWNHSPGLHPPTYPSSILLEPWRVKIMAWEAHPSLTVPWPLQKCPCHSNPSTSTGSAVPEP